jgi:hypothetical protein
VTATIYREFDLNRLSRLSDAAAKEAHLLEDELEYLDTALGGDEDLDDDDDEKQGEFEDRDDGWVLVGGEDDEQDADDDWFDGFDADDGENDPDVNAE